MKIKCILLSVFLVFCNLANANTDKCEIPKEGRDLLTIFPPSIQAKIEIQTGHPKFIAVYGITILVPGVSSKQNVCLVQEKMVRIISGTSDSPCSEALEMFNIAVGLYAEEFNKQLLLQNTKLKNHICFSVKKEKN